MPYYKEFYTLVNVSVLQDGKVIDSNGEVGVITDDAVFIPGVYKAFTALDLMVIARHLLEAESRLKKQV